jgi:hypothetical protein
MIIPPIIPAMIPRNTGAPGFSLFCWSEMTEETPNSRPFSERAERTENLRLRFLGACLTN